MSEPRVLNCRTHGVPLGAVYVGRPTKWGNPYVLGGDKARPDMIEKYREHLARQMEMGRLKPEELRGKDLVCWCAPLPCHADVLLEVANAEGAPKGEK